MHYGGKVIELDVNHYEGTNVVLLVKSNHYIGWMMQETKQK
jgi:hypothetical protein